VDKVIDATGNTDAEQLVREWQAELEEKKEEKKGQQMMPTKLLYGHRNTIDEMLDIGSNWFSHSRDDEKKEGMIPSWSRRVNDIPNIEILLILWL